MAKSQHTQEERQLLCNTARRLLKSGARFGDICETFGLKSVTLRKWMNDQTRDMIYPRVPNVGRM